MITALMGDPGTGKSTMAYLTSPRKPVHVIDIDRKASVMPAFRLAHSRGDLTYYEIGETLTEEKSFSARMNALVEKNADKTMLSGSGMVRQPLGWNNFAGYLATLEEKEEFKKSGTLVVDSYTALKAHLRVHINFLRGKGKYTFDDWTAWAMMWNELTVALIDCCKQYDKDLVIIFHEAIREKPGDQATKVTVKTGPKGDRQREYMGIQDVKVVGSMEGSFAMEFGAYFTDVYSLKVVMENKQPKWVCRVLPDGQRSLRCSFDVKGVAEWEPDFRKIWKG